MRPRWVWSGLWLALLLPVLHAIVFLGPQKSLTSQNGVLYSNYELAAVCFGSDINVPQTAYIYDDTNSTIIGNMTIICGAPQIVYEKNLVTFVPLGGQLAAIEICKARDNMLYNSGYATNYTAQQISQLNALAGGTPANGFPQHWKVPRWAKESRRYSTPETDPVRGFDEGPYQPPAHHDQPIPETAHSFSKHNGRRATANKRGQTYRPTLADLDHSDVIRMAGDERPDWFIRNENPRFHERKLLFSFGSFATSFLPSLGPVGGLVGGLLSGFGVGGGGYDLTADPAFQAQQQATVNLSNALNAQVTAQKDWNSQTATLITALNRQQGAVDNTTGATIQSINVLNLQTQQLNATLNQMASLVATQFGSTNTAIQQQGQQLLQTQGLITSLSGAFSAQQLQIIQGFANISNATNATINSLATSVQSQINSLYNLIRQGQRRDRKILGLIQSNNLDETRKLQMTLAVFQVLANVTSSGADLRPFLLSYNEPPAVNPNAYAELTIDTYRMFYTGNNGGPILFQTDMTIYCDTMSLTAQPQGWFSIQDFMDYLGPAGCALSQTCLCYIQTTKYQCTYNPAAGFDRITGTQTITNSTAVVPSICTTPATFVSSTTIDNLAAWQSFLQGRCSEQAPMNSQVFIVSLFTGKLSNTSYGATSPACSAINTGTVMETSMTYPGVEFALFNQIGVSFQVVKPVLVDTYTALNGGMPQGLSFQWTPFVRRNGQDLDCMTGRFMLYTNELVPVYALTNPILDVAFSVSINGVTTTQTDILLGQTSGFSLEPRFNIIGEPDSQTVIYDIPQFDVPLGPVAAGRAGKPTYANFPNASCSTQQCWVAMNGVPFDAASGASTPSLYARPFNPTTRSCLGPARSYGGSWCTILDDYFHVCPNNATCISTARNPTYEVFAIRVPGPVLATIIYSSCPTVQVDAYPSGVQVTLSSIQNVPITVQMVITGPCPETRTGIVIPATGTTIQYVKTCPTVPTTRPLSPHYWSNLTIFQQQGSGFVVCNSSVNINVTGDRVGMLATTGLTDLNATIGVSIQYADPVTVQMANLYGQLSQQNLQTNIFVASTLQFLQLTDTVTFQDVTSAILNQSLSLYNATTQSINNTYNTLSQYNLLNSLSSFTDRFNQLQANATANIQAAQAAYLIQLNDTAQTNAAIATYANTTAKLIIADGLLNASFQSYLSTTQNLFSAIAKGFNILSSSGDGPFGFLSGSIFGLAGSILSAGESVVSTVYDGVSTVVSDVYHDVKMLADAVVALAIQTMQSFANLFTALTTILPWCLIGGALLFFGYKFYQMYQHGAATTGQGRMRGSDGRTYDAAELAERYNDLKKALLQWRQAHTSQNTGMIQMADANLDATLAQPDIKGKPYKPAKSSGLSFLSNPAGRFKAKARAKKVAAALPALPSIPMMPLPAQPTPAPAPTPTGVLHQAYAQRTPHQQESDLLMRVADSDSDSDSLL